MYDVSMSIGSGFGRISRQREGWLDGEVVTPHGIVSVFAQGDSTHDHYSRLDFAYAGRLYIRSFNKRYSPRGLVTKAKQFSREVIEHI